MEDNRIILRTPTGLNTERERDAESLDIDTGMSRHIQQWRVPQWLSDENTLYWCVFFPMRCFFPISFNIVFGG